MRRQPLALRSQYLHLLNVRAPGAGIGIPVHRAIDEAHQDGFFVHKVSGHARFTAQPAILIYTGLATISQKMITSDMKAGIPSITHQRR